MAWTEFNGIYTIGDQRYFAVAEDDVGEDSAEATAVNTVVPIIDDGDAGFDEISGTWTNSTSGYNGDARSAAAGSRHQHAAKTRAKTAPVKIAFLIACPSSHGMPRGMQTAATQPIRLARSS